MDTNANVNALNFQTLTGVSIAHSFQPTVCSNHTNQTGAGLSFTGGCGGSRINLNQFNQCFHGVNLDYANIASGSASTTAGDNEWINNVGIDKITGFIINSNHTWYWNPSIVNSNPSTYTINSFPPFTYSFLDQIDYNTSACGIYSVRSSNVEDDITNPALLNSIATGYFQYLNNDTGYTSRLFNDLYFLDEYNRHDSLIETERFNIEDYMLFYDYRQLLYDSTSNIIQTINTLILNKNYNTALNLNNTIVPRYTADEVFKNVCGIYLNYLLADTITITESAENYLLSIANSEASYLGPGVYTARALLALLGENEEKSQISETQNPPFTINTQSIFPCPNPSIGIVQFCGNFNNSDIFRFELINSLGIVVFSTNINNIKNAYTNLGYLRSGSYIYKLINDTGQVFKGKLILNNQN